MGKRNCWEVKGCGREPMGINAHKDGVCPAATEEKLNSVHGGKNAGRACWIVKATLCDGSVQGTFADKLQKCMECDFYNQVKKEEFPKFKLSALLLKLLDDKNKSKN